MANEPKYENGALTEDEISALVRGALPEQSKCYHLSDDELAHVCQIVNDVAARNLTFEYEELTPDNTRTRKGGGRKAARQIYSWIKWKDNFDAEVDRFVILALVRQLFANERNEVVVTEIFRRLNEWC